MLWILLLSLGLLCGSPTTLASNVRPLDSGRFLLDEAGSSSPSRLQIADEPSDFEQLAILEMPIAQDEPVPAAMLRKREQTLLTSQGREERSPRRCVRLQESCLGHKLPCCDPCATCYCRFFNANCFCKRFSNTFPCGRN